jgi:hypothetical protein
LELLVGGVGEAEETICGKAYGAAVVEFDVNGATIGPGAEGGGFQREGSASERGS